jgi:23S rRNA (uracil1939-C5)-methyltransferase
VTVEKWVYGGDSLSRAEGHVVMTPYLLPGETARVEETQSRRGLIKALPREILAASQHRVAPPCAHFSRCGGCHYQHAAYEYQVGQKAEILREQFQRVGHIDFRGEIDTVAGPALGYRNRTQLHVDRGRIGYFGEGSHELVSVDTCPISSPKINEAIAALAEMVRDRRWPAFLKTIELFTNESEVLINVLEASQPVARRFFEWCSERIPGAERGYLHYPASGCLFQVSHNSFFQVNRFLLDPLVETAVGDEAGDWALDLYAGVGLFSLALAKRFAKVTAVESGASAVRDLKQNAERAGVRLEAVQANVEGFLGRDGFDAGFVLADPPRGGLGKTVVADLVRRKPAHIVIVACDPSTLARDLAGLIANGYSIEKVTMVDLFPQTYHLESVVRLRKE